MLVVNRRMPNGTSGGVGAGAGDRPGYPISGVVAASTLRASQSSWIDLRGAGQLVRIYGSEKSD